MTPTDPELDERLAFAIDIVSEAGQAGLAHFREIDTLAIERKGHQDLVSNADRELERLIRDAIDTRFADDGIVGEEYGRKAGTSGLTWIIDPIDGTANFVAGIPAWTVVLACVSADHAEVAVIADPNAGEVYAAARGRGAQINGAAMTVSGSESLGDGTTGVGFNGRVNADLTVRLIDNLVADGGVFYRNASGALMLAYVAAGRLIGYTEAHMNAWDCVAGMLLVEEAGGRCWPVEMSQMVEVGGPVIAAGPGVYDQLAGISARAYRMD